MLSNGDVSSPCDINFSRCRIVVVFEHQDGRIGKGMKTRPTAACKLWNEVQQLCDRHVPRYLTLLSLSLFVLTGSLLAQNWGAPVWSDEFNGAANSAPDSTKWTYDVGNLNVNH